MRSATVLWHLLLIFPPLCSALTFTLDPYQTDRPVPDTVMYFTATREAGDPQVVVVALVNEEIGNTTVMFGTHDLVALPDAGFRLPFVPPGSQYVVRMTDTTSGRRILAESEPFSVYPPGTPPSSTAVTSENMTATILTTTSTTITTTTTTPSPSVTQDVPAPNKPAVPLGAIIGGAVGGGVVLLLVFGILIYCIRRQGRPVTAEELEKKKQRIEQKKKAHDNNKDVSISPFLVNDPVPSTPFAGDSTTNLIDPDASRSSSSGGPVGAVHQYESARHEKSRLANNSNYFNTANVHHLPTEATASSTLGEGSSSAGGAARDRGSSSEGSRSHIREKSSRRTLDHSEEYELSSTATSSAIARAEELRRERERIDQEISYLERTSSMGGSKNPRRGSATTTENDERMAAAEMAALRETMHDIAIGSSSERRTVPPPDEPPPEYYAASTIGLAR